MVYLRLAGRPEVSTEEWRVVDSAPIYEVSSEGRVRSWWPTGRQLPYVMRPHRWKGKRGGYYLKVCLTLEKHRHKTILVHKLVTTAFIGPRPEDKEVRHLNGDGTDNRLENLRYGTKSENRRDTIRHGRDRNASKTHCKRGHEYTEANTTWARGKHGMQRQCQTCRTEWYRATTTCKPRRDDYWTHCPRGHEKTPENMYVSPKGARKCRICTLDQQRRCLGTKPRDLTRCKRGHEYTAESVYVIPSSGHRQCRICKTEYMRERYQQQQRLARISSASDDRLTRWLAETEGQESPWRTALEAEADRRWYVAVAR